jgi:hypothetical protein
VKGWAEADSVRKILDDAGVTLKEWTVADNVTGSGGRPPPNATVVDVHQPLQQRT